MSVHDTLDPAPGGRPLRGRTVLFILLGFFATVATVNGVMMYLAVSTFSGEVVAHPYERGLAYNHDIAEAKAQMARGWSVEAHVARSADGIAHVTAKTGQRGLVLRATLASPADKKRDVDVALVETTPGVYEGAAPLPAGWRDVVLVASRDGRELFRSKNRVQIE